MVKGTDRVPKHVPHAGVRGVDMALVRWMLRPTPSQRLAVLQDHVNLVSTLRRGKATD